MPDWGQWSSFSLSTFLSKCMLRFFFLEVAVLDWFLCVNWNKGSYQWLKKGYFILLCRIQKSDTDSRSKELSWMYFLFFLFFRGPEDTINDCKILFIEEMYKIEKPGAYPLTFGDGDFKSMHF